MSNIMLQFHLEIVCDFIAALVYLIIGVAFLIQGWRRKNLALQIFAFFSFGFVFSFGFQALSYMVMLEDYALAILFKQVAEITNKIPPILFFIWIDYVQTERVRPLTMLPIVSVVVAYATMILSTSGGFILYIYTENGVPIAYTIGKTGVALIFDVFALLMEYIAMLWYFFNLFRHAPPQLKQITKDLAIVIYLMFFVEAAILLSVRSFPQNTIALLIYSISALLPVILVAVFTMVVFRFPQVLFILSFQVSRLFVIQGESGKNIFNFRFRYQPVDELRFSSLLQGLQEISMDVLHAGDLREIQYEHGVLMLHKYPLFTVGLQGSRYSKYLAACVDQFAQAFKNQFNTQLEKEGGTATDFDGALPLIDLYFQYIPRDTQKIRSTDWTPGPQHVPERK